jgi:ribosomal protein RSM22 (predicted rRNA methylase)
MTHPADDNDSPPFDDFPSVHYTHAIGEEHPEVDWDRLLDLRDSYLDGSAGKADYWEDAEMLADYDATFGRRIAWKWDWVLADLKRLGWSPPEGVVQDWGCGPGVALRTFAEVYPVAKAAFSDRSVRAVRFAGQQLKAEYPDVELCSLAAGDAPALLLVSHVLSELDDAGLQALVSQMEAAECVLWVEPGTSAENRRMLPVREMLLKKGFRVVAPCTHADACPMLQPEHSQHWCHHFAAPPSRVFMDSFWAYFAKHMGVDLRSLPLSYLLLDKRPQHAAAVSPALAEATRVIGRYRVYKPYSLLLACDAAGLREAQVTKRRHPELFRRMRHRECVSLVNWEVSGKEAVKIVPWD